MWNLKEGGELKGSCKEQETLKSANAQTDTCRHTYTHNHTYIHSHIYTYTYTHFAKDVVLLRTKLYV